METYEASQCTQTIWNLPAKSSLKWPLWAGVAVAKWPLYLMNSGFSLSSILKISFPFQDANNYTFVFPLYNVPVCLQNQHF